MSGSRDIAENIAHSDHINFHVFNDHVEFLSLYEKKV